MKKLIISVLAVMMVSSAFGANWIEIGKSDEDGGFTVYIDTETVRKVNNYNKQIYYFIKFDYAKAQKTKSGKYYNYEVWQKKGDCENRKSSLMAYVSYSKNGTNIDSSSRSYDDWEAVFPDTIGETNLELACYIAGYGSEP